MLISAISSLSIHIGKRFVNCGGSSPAQTRSALCGSRSLSRAYCSAVCIAARLSACQRTSPAPVTQPGLCSSESLSSDCSAGHQPCHSHSLSPPSIRNSAATDIATLFTTRIHWLVYACLGRNKNYVNLFYSSGHRPKWFGCNDQLRSSLQC